MTYSSIVKGEFLDRPNRFIAKVLVDGVEETVHVKNTGRCRELLTDHAIVYLEPSDNPQRKTKFSLIAVEKGDRLINMDSQAPNKVVEEALRSGKQLQGLPFPLDLIRREYTYGHSRLDFYLEKGEEKILIEVKGVTLERDGAVFFPDAPTLRGIKHLEELAGAIKEGYRSISLYVIQMEEAEYFSPNRETESAYADALVAAEKAGVELIAFTCHVTPEGLSLKGRVPIRL